MGKKGRKTRWRKLPIAIGNDDGQIGTCDANGAVVNEDELERDDIKSHQHHHNHHHHHHNHHQNHQHNNYHQHHHQPTTNSVTKTTFNEDEYTKITTPRQDMLFKKGYLGKKKSTVVTTPPQDSIDTQSADSVESDQYICEEQMQSHYMYPPNGYMDHTGLYYINSNYEVYDPYYSGNMMVVVGPGYPTAPHTGVLTAVPCQPVPLQSLEWFNPSVAQPHPAYSVPVYSSRKKRNSIDSQNCSGQSSETTGPPGSPQEPVEGSEPPVFSPQYVYPGYMFGAPLYNMNGVTVQGVVPQSAPLPPPADQAKRRKKRRRRRRGGVTDEGSESSCEDVLSCDASGAAESHSGASSDTAPGSSSSKTNSDSGIHTDPTTLTSGTNSPRLPVDEPYFHTETNEHTEENIAYQPEIEETITEQQVGQENTKNEERSQIILPSEVDDGLKEIEKIEPEIVTSVDCSENMEEKSGSFDAEIIDESNEPSVINDIVLPVTNMCNNESIVDEVKSEETIEENIEETINLENEKLTIDKEEIVVKETKEIQEIQNEIIDTNENDIDVITNRLSEQTIREGSSERPITEAVTKWLRSQNNAMVKLNHSSTSSTESEDEGIEEGEDALSPTTLTNATGQKNVEGNPFLASSPSSDNGIRVAIHDCIHVVEEQEDCPVNHMCDARRSVHKYYRLGNSASDHAVHNDMLLKTAMHINHAGPFPCGVCCILQ